jgi:large subunit ribosomal protein L29
MLASELRTKNVDELRKEIENLLKTHFNLRMQKAAQQLVNLTELGNVRRSVARAMTILNEKKREARSE